MNKIIFITLIITQIYCQNTIMLTFDTPGSFVLTPEMYHYADSFIIEMWGAGGGSEYCGGPGGSGAYIQSLIYTNQSNFDVVIGRGGHSNFSTTICGYNYCGMSQSQQYKNGGYTSITNDNLNFIAGGGTNNGYPGNATTLTTDTRTKIYQSLDGYYGGAWARIDPCISNGVPAPYGGSGGIYNTAGLGYVGIVNNTYPINGFTPGGSGSNAYATYYNSTCNGWIFPSGGNGTIILYLSPKNQPDNTPTNPVKIVSYFDNVILTPDMYQSADNFIIKMWGAGASSGYNCCTPTNPGYGAGSGAYIKAIINTGQQTFNITIGKGGKPPIYFPPSCFTSCAEINTYNFNGGQTSIVSPDVNFIAGGGFRDSGGEILSTVTFNSNNIVLVAQKGNMYNCSFNYTGFGLTNKYNGGVAPYSSAYNNSYGSGFYDNVCDSSSCNTITIPSGGNGIVMLYFTPKSTSFTSSPTVNPIRTTSLPTIISTESITYSHPVESSKIFVTITSYNSTQKETLVDFLIIVCVIATIIALLMILIVIMYCIKSTSNKFNFDIKCDQRIVLDDI